MSAFRTVAFGLLFVLAGCAGNFLGNDKSQAVSQVESEIELWRAIETSKNPALIRKYLTLYPTGRFSLPARVRLLEQGPVDTPGALARGLTAYREHRYDEALRFLWPQAEVGEPLAQQKLGLMYLAGWGIEADIVQAFKWLTLAEAGGIEDAQISRSFAGATMNADQHDTALSLIEAYRPLSRTFGRGV